MRVSSNRRPRGGRVNSGNNRTGGNTARSGQNNNRRSNAGNRNYDSNGPDGKIRGTANQVYDKYVALATDAHTSGDHVSAENYFQHAEHYFRIIAANNLVQKERQPSEQATLPSDDEGVSQQVETKENPKQEKISKERREEDNSDEAIVLDLSKTDQPAIDLPDADGMDYAER